MIEKTVRRIDVAETSTTSNDGFSWIPVSLVDGNRDQTRRSVKRSSMEELVESVREHGVLQPIRVRRRGPRYEVIAGHRRVMAAAAAGLETVPAVVVEATDHQALIEALVENIQREDLNPLERGEALRRLRTNLGAKSWEEVGRAIGISRRHVYHLLNVTALPEPIREDIQAGTVSEKHGRALLRLRDHPELQLRLWQRITAERVSGDEALGLARELIGSPGGAVAQVAPSQAGPEVRSLKDLVDYVLLLLPRASMNEVRPLRGRLELLARRLSELLYDAFYAEKEDEDEAVAAGVRVRG
jgi:ParB family chromosome partitioning protein